jgi:hypothetical protein
MSRQAWDCGTGRGNSAVGRLARLAVRQRVDDAIVMLQTIHRHIEDGLRPIEAALAAQHEGADDHWRGWGTRLEKRFLRYVL